MESGKQYKAVEKRLVFLLKNYSTLLGISIGCTTQQKFYLI